MTLLFLFLLTILATVFFNKRKAALVLLIFLSLHLILSGGGIVTRVFLNELQSAERVDQPEWKESNAIVVLGFGTVAWPIPFSEVTVRSTVTTSSFGYARLFEGLRLYQDCKKVPRECRILLTGGDPMLNGQTEGDVMARELSEAGVPRADLIVENKSNNTFQNAKNSAPLLRGFGQIYLVTSGIHMKRAMKFFTHFIKGVTPAPADRMHALLSVIPISPNLIFFDFALHEYVGILTYHVYNFMGWNPPPV